ncbi:MAG TPA: response regulator [Burkholderiaceae bacterium]|nr:response regulator [Burkholderiaceae bacterium]
MIGMYTARAIVVLMVEDNPGDVRLTREALKDGKIWLDLNVVEDGTSALDYLHRRGAYPDALRPDLILLDLNLPRMDGREVLAAIKQHEELKTIPVVILTTSHAEADVLRAYELNANCYVTKPVDFDQFQSIVKMIEQFWFGVVMLPPHER